jgi:dipeptidyl aminopeptidase/acylaminoacyl peptidase
LLLIHGGPASEDSHKINRFIVETLKLGYPILQVNYRGSTGRGIAHVKLDEKNWGTGIPKDILSTIKFLESSGYKFGPRAAFGESFGGYLAILLATKYESLDCAASYAAPTDFQSFITFTVSRGLNDLLSRIGNPNNELELKQIKKISPLTYAGKTKVPLLLMHGAQDKIVPVSQTNSFFEARKKYRKPVFVVITADGTHELTKANDQQVLPNELRNFLRKCVGFKFKPT